MFDGYSHEGLNTAKGAEILQTQRLELKYFFTYFLQFYDWSTVWCHVAYVSKNMLYFKNKLFFFPFFPRL